MAAARGGSFLAAGTIFEYASRFVISLMLARVLGAQDYGLYVLAVSAVALGAAVSSLGLDEAMVRYVAILTGRRDHGGVWGTLRVGAGVSVLAGIILGGLCLVSARPIAEGVFEEPRLIPLLRALAVVLPFLTVSNVLAGIARGFRRMGSVALAENVVQSLVRMALLGALAMIGTLDVLTAVIIFGIADVAASATLLVLIGRRFPLEKPGTLEIRYEVRELFRFGIPLWLSRLLRQFRRNIEVLLLGALASASSVGIFAVVGRVNLVAHVFLLSLFISVKPLLARLHDEGDAGRLLNLYRGTTRWALILNLPVFVVTILYPKAILSVFGEPFTAGAGALIVLAVAEFVNAGTGTCGPLLDMAGHTRWKLANAVLFTLLLTGSSALLIPRLGVLGAAWATFIAVVTVNLLTVAEVWLLERLFPFDRTFIKPVVAGVVAFGVGLGLQRWAEVGVEFERAAGQGAVVGLVYLGILLALGLEEDDRTVIDRVVQRARGVMWARGPAA